MVGLQRRRMDWAPFFFVRLFQAIKNKLESSSAGRVRNA
jgi:hypothetical protein